MAAQPDCLASAAVGGLVLSGVAGVGRARRAARRRSPPVARVASFAPGSIRRRRPGRARRRRSPASWSRRSARRPTVAVTDETGRFEFGTLAPGPYLVRAHLAGYRRAARPDRSGARRAARASSSIALRHAPRRRRCSPLASASSATRRADAAAPRAGSADADATVDRRATTITARRRGGCAMRAAAS